MLCGRAPASFSKTKVSICSSARDALIASRSSASSCILELMKARMCSLAIGPLRLSVDLWIIAIRGKDIGTHFQTSWTRPPDHYPEHLCSLAFGSLGMEKQQKSAKPVCGDDRNEFPTQNTS